MDVVVTNHIDPRIFRDPSDVPDGAYGYALRAQAAQRKTTTFAGPETFLLIFDSTAEGRNATAELSTVPNPGRHHGIDNGAYLDGHARHLVGRG